MLQTHMFHTYFQTCPDMFVQTISTKTMVREPLTRLLLVCLFAASTVAFFWFLRLFASTAS